MKSILFIINPIPIYTNHFKIDAVLDFFGTDYQLTFKYTQYHKHATELAQQGIKDGCDVIIAVGGDGTIFEVAQALVFTSVALGIIRTGYSSAFPNELGFPFSVQKSLEVIQMNKRCSIDVLKISGDSIQKPIYGLSYIGVGISSGVVHRVPLDAHKNFKVIWLNLLQAFFDRKQYPVTAKFHYETIDIEPFELLISNISQFPNYIKLFQSAKLNDGIADIIVANKMPFYRYSRFLLNKLLRINDKVAEYVHFYKSDSVKLFFHKKTPIQVDNEPFIAEGELEIQICNRVLDIIIPDGEHKCLV